jgi:hypothetical protein
LWGRNKEGVAPLSIAILRAANANV